MSRDAARRPSARLAVVGAGQIGSRHLQALALLEHPARVAVFDPHAPSLERARERFESVVARNSEVEAAYSDRPDVLPETLDVAVVATTADTRLAALRDLLGRSRVRHVILEKVLFQSVGELEQARELFARCAVTAWVNCPCRMWPHYVALKAELGGAKIIGLRLVGSNWGLACNAIHMLDLVAFFNGTAELTLETSRLDPEPVAARRPGFLEFTGALTGRFADGCLVDLVSYREGAVPSTVEIETPVSRHLIDEVGGQLWQARESEAWRGQRTSIELPLQSRLTHLVVGALLATDRCALTPYAESARLHVPLLAALLEHLRRDPARGALDRCPIT